MYKVRKAHGDKVILDDVTLSFLPGAKIGVVGPNGAGKSSVLRIMAGLGQPAERGGAPMKGYTPRVLAQEATPPAGQGGRGHAQGRGRGGRGAARPSEGDCPQHAV